VEYEDRLRIETPEGVDLDLRLAGLGSRFVATVIDLLIMSGIVVALGLALVGVEIFAEGSVGTGWGAAVFSVVFFLVILGYDILFEVLASGRTPGKRWTGLRVVRTGGQPVRFLTSAIRNLLRLVDFLPFLYLAGSVSILVTRRNQRLGDLAADTLVVRERGGVDVTARRPFDAQGELDVELAWDVSAITAEELSAVRAFLERRGQLTPDARVQLARTLAGRLRGKVAGAAVPEADERFLERLAAVKAARG
jgi:uncharacterized RDD family membrane protein YckC